MILVCAADDFRKNQKKSENYQFLKKHKKICHKQKVKFLVFFKSTRRVCIQLYLYLDKNCTQNAFFLQKDDFCIFEPKNREVIENSSKTPVNNSPLQCIYLGKNSFQYY